MAEITRRRSGELVRGVFKLLLAHPEGMPAKAVLEELPKFVPPTDFENTTFPRRPDTRRYEKVVRFSTISSVKAGWLIKDKGNWILTDLGRRADEVFPDPERFMRESRVSTGSGLWTSLKRAKWWPTNPPPMRQQHLKRLKRRHGQKSKSTSRR